MSPPTSFGPFSLDADRHQLLEAGHEVHLSPKAYELLKLLLGERPRALSKTELHERLWPGTFVSDATLASVVAEIRTALGDTGRDGRYIRTVHAYGYAFAAEASDDVGTDARPEPSRTWLDGGDFRFNLRDGDNIVGREADADVCLDAATISRHHARIAIGGGGATIDDLGSKNGTWVNGVQVTTAVSLEDGDEIRFGAVVMRFRNLREPGSTVTLRLE